MPTLDRRLKTWTRTFALATTASCVLSIAAAAGPKDASKNAPKDAPAYKVDPVWPKPLPNKWLMQGVPVTAVDKGDHIRAMNRPRDGKPDAFGAASNPPRSDCCTAAPAVLDFDTLLQLLKAWG